MTNKIQVRRGTAAEWTAADPLLANGEPGFESDTGSVKVGDGVKVWSNLPYTVPSSVPSAVARTSVTETLLRTTADSGGFSSSFKNLMEHLIGSNVVSSINEWGALRGTAPYSWGDALVRGIRESWDTITSGNYLELVDRRSGAPADPGHIVHARRWTDGGLVRNGIAMADAIILSADQDPPALLPEGSLVVRHPHVGLPAHNEIVHFFADGLGNGLDIVATTAGTGDTPVSSVAGTPLEIRDNVAVVSFPPPYIEMNLPPTGSPSVVRWNVGSQNQLGFGFRLKTPSQWGDQSLKIFGGLRNNVVDWCLTLGGSGSPGQLRVIDTEGFGSEAGTPNDTLSTSSQYCVFGSINYDIDEFRLVITNFDRTSILYDVTGTILTADATDTIFLGSPSSVASADWEIAFDEITVIDVAGIPLDVVARPGGVFQWVGGELKQILAAA